MFSTLLTTLTLASSEPIKHEPLPRAAKKSYATCYDLQGTTASGKPVGPRTAAHNWLPFHTKIRIVGKNAGPGGLRRFIIRDTGPALSDGHFDLWAKSGCMKYGKRTIYWKLGWSR